MNRTNLRLTLIALNAVACLASNAQLLTNMGKEWRVKESWRAHALFNQLDLSPIEKAFTMGEVDMLWAYHGLAEMQQFGRPRADTPEEISRAQFTEQERNALNLEIQELAMERLRQLPGLARYLGDRIEKSASEKGWNDSRRIWLSILGRVGGEESIVELGRFIFDDRNPDYTPPLDSGPVYPIGIPSAIQYSATSALNGALRGKHTIADEIKDKTYGMNPNWFKMIHHWWLHSEEAAPYRRKLADAGVVLPPGYPPMKELQGARTTIAPATAKPLQAEQTQPGANQDQAPAPVPPPVVVTEDPVKPWMLVVALVAGILISVLMAVRRGLIGKPRRE
jgi:hypothetical protein